MQIFTKVSELQTYLQKFSHQKIGFVPTMGALHAGHLSLVKAAQAKCNLTVVSIFVNPTQFAPHEDLDKYPRHLEKDKFLLLKNQVNVLFLPTKEEIYPNAFKPEIPNLPDFTKILEGKSRPTHFQGVAQVVKRLFEIIQPTGVFFGQKDYQQTLLIKWLIQIFDFNINLQVCPIIRDLDGLALSSRNQYLSFLERKTALILSQTLDTVRKRIRQGETEVQKLEKAMREQVVGCRSQLKFEYAVIRDKTDLSEQTLVTANSIALLAVKVGETRLIDNMFL